MEDEEEDVRPPPSLPLPEAPNSVSRRPSARIQPVPELLAVAETLSVKFADEEIAPSALSGSFAHKGSYRATMEDEHIRIDDLSMQFGPPIRFPQPTAFYAVFDGHGGSEAADYVKNNFLRLLLNDAEFPTSNHVVDEGFVDNVKDSLRRVHILADRALANDPSLGHTAGTTALTAFIFGRLLVVSNVGDCRAVLCRNGNAIEMSRDHRPNNVHERERVRRLGAYVVNGRLNGVLSLTRALGDWDMKTRSGTNYDLSPLISDPEFRHTVLTDEDEFLILGSDGIWGAMSSHQAVSFVRRRLGKRKDPERCARDLVYESFIRGAQDNATVIVVRLSNPADRDEPSHPPRRWRLGFCNWP